MGLEKFEVVNTDKDNNCSSSSSLLLWVLFRRFSYTPRVHKPRTQMSSILQTLGYKFFELKSV